MSNLEHPKKVHPIHHQFHKSLVATAVGTTAMPYEGWGRTDNAPLNPAFPARILGLRLLYGESTADKFDYYLYAGPDDPPIMVQEQATVALRDKADSSSLKAQNYYSDHAPRHAVYAPEADELGLILQALQTARDEADLHFTLRVIEDDLPWRCENIPDIHQDVAWIQERRSYLQQVGMTVGELLLAAPLPRHQA